MSIKDFQILAKIGDGSYSSVFKVRRIIDECVYALKKVTLEHLSNREIQNAINQVRFLASARHPNIIAYKEAFYDSPSRSLCIIMEYADDGDLLQRIFQNKRNGSHFPEQYIWDIFIQILKGLTKLHELKITHRDLKSANIFLTKSGLAKIGDFNVSTVLRKGAMCDTQTGTPYYASPQIWKDEPYDAKSDMWSLGCVLYEFIHLKPPFRARDMEGLSKKVSLGYFGKISRNYSNDFAQILMVMLNPDPFERMNCKDLLQHFIIKQKMKKTKQIINLESSSLLKTIRLVKNMNYLTEKLPKPNYSPVRFKSMRQVTGSVIFDRKMKKATSETLPKLQKSLQVSKNRSQRHNISLSDQQEHYRHMNPQNLPKIKLKGSRRY